MEENLLLQEESAIRHLHIMQNNSRKLRHLHYRIIIDQALHIAQIGDLLHQQLQHAANILQLMELQLVFLTIQSTIPPIPTIRNKVTLMVPP